MRSTCSLLFATAIMFAAGCAADTDERPATFEYIEAAILRPGCATAACHDAQSRTQRIDFSSVQAAVDSIDSRGLVSPHDPDHSQIYFLLTVTGDDKRMPLDGPLPQADIDLIGRWIDDGAVMP